MDIQGDVSDNTIAISAFVVWLKNPPYSEQLSGVQVNPAIEFNGSQQTGLQK